MFIETIVWLTLAYFVLSTVLFALQLLFDLPRGHRWLRRIGINWGISSLLFSLADIFSTAIIGTFSRSMMIWGCIRILVSLAAIIGMGMVEIEDEPADDIPDNDHETMAH